MRLVGDLFVSGTETTATSICWGVLQFLHQPEIQKKCFEEVERVIGFNRIPTMLDKPNMVYLEATINEILRWANITPFSLRGLAYDVEFRGFSVPKEAFVLANFESALHDKQIWEDPENFRPERFIDSDGKLVKPDDYIPFGIGEYFPT